MTLLKQPLNLLLERTKKYHKWKQNCQEENSLSKYFFLCVKIINTGSKLPIIGNRFAGNSLVCKLAII